MPQSPPASTRAISLVFAASVLAALAGFKIVERLLGERPLLVIVPAMLLGACITVGLVAVVARAVLGPAAFVRQPRRTVSQPGRGELARGLAILAAITVLLSLWIGSNVVLFLPLLVGPLAFWWLQREIARG